MYFFFSTTQELISTTKSFGDAYDSIHLQLTSIKERFHAADGLQPDILAKKSQADQLKVSLESFYFPVASFSCNRKQ